MTWLRTPETLPDLGTSIWVATPKVTSIVQTGYRVRPGTYVHGLIGASYTTRLGEFWDWYPIGLGFYWMPRVEGEPMPEVPEEPGGAVNVKQGESK